MRFAEATSELLAASDATVDDAVQHADPMVLRGLLHQLTGDEEVAAIRPTPQVGIDAAKLVDGDGIARLRAKAAAFLTAHRDTSLGGGPPAPEVHAWGDTTVTTYHSPSVAGGSSSTVSAVDGPADDDVFVDYGSA